MRYLLAIPAALALGACAGFTLPSPSSVGGSENQIAARLAEFCRADFADANIAALQEWVTLYNLVAPMIEREPIDTASLTERDAVRKLLAVRAAVCLATQPLPAPAVVEAVEAVEG